MSQQSSHPGSHPGSRTTSPMVGPYRLLTRLGEGGMGIVHLAQGPDGHRVALKVLRPQVVGDAEARERLAREVASLGRVRSPWVAQIIAADPWSDVPYVVTRYVPGLSLHDHVAAEGPVAGRDLLWLAGCLAEGLAAVHGVGVLHRDIKPGNVLMEGRTPILIDFGLARVAEDVRITQTGWLLGTPGYLAPEILYGEEATPAVDVHAWAATVAYAASGRGPYGRGPGMAIMDRTRRGEHDLSGIEQPIADVLAAALHPDPLERPLLEELLAWLRPLSTRPDLPPVAPPGALFAPAPDGPDGPDGSGASDGSADAPVGDPTTIPLVLARETDPSLPPPPPTPLTRPDQVLPDPPAPPEPVLATVTPLLPVEPARPTEPLPSGAEPTLPPPGAMSRMERDFDQQFAPAIGADGQPVWIDPTGMPPAKRPLAERLRWWSTIGAAAVAIGAGVAAAPWITLALVTLTVWLVRAGSLAASAIARRRTVRGAKWYDALRWLSTSPWHGLRAITGTLILVSWSAGLGLAAGLVGYALALDVPSTLMATGAVMGVALWSGPGSNRFRYPIARALTPLVRQPLPSLLVIAALLAVAALLAAVATGQGVAWAPWSSGPFGL